MRELLLYLILGWVNCQLLEKSRSVWVEQGLVRGNIYNIDGKHIQIFRGIPYAEPPIGENRLKPPVKKTRWHQELPAVEYGPPCLQFMDFHKNDKFAKANMERQSEDCLYLNVFSPYDTDDESKTYPILVWIHGGSFLAGSADTGIDMEVIAANIVSKEIAFVSINYRLGPLGFMNYQNGDKLEGNFGIWDMVMALQWIQSNMKQFNGDPTRVTVMGESAGGAASSLLALSPKTTGLLHQAIIMSGSSMAGWAIHRHSQPAYSVDNLVAYFRSLDEGCEKWINEEDTKEVVGDEYQHLTQSVLRSSLCNYQNVQINCLSDDMTQVDKMNCLRKELNFSSPLFRKALAAELGVSKMVVDGDLVPSSGVSLVRNNARIPIMTGVARKEWGHKKAMFYNMHQRDGLKRSDVEEQVYRIIDNSFHETASEKLANSTIQLIANATIVRYLETPSNEFNADQVVGALQKLESDLEFVAPCEREVSAYVERGVPVYLYSFDYVTKSPILESERKIYSLFGTKPVEMKRTEKSEILEKAAFHGLDHAFIFSKGYSSNFEISPYTKREETMSKILCTMLTNFVKKGDPSTSRLLEGEIHFPDAQFWNTEAELITRYVSKDSETDLDPDAVLNNEERVQLFAYRRAFNALWVLVGIISILMTSDDFPKYIAISCEYTFPFLAVLGVLGNAITLFVLLSKSMRSSTNEMLAAAALSDILYIIFMTPNQMSRWPSIVSTDCIDDPSRKCPSSFHMWFAENKHHLAFLLNWVSAASTWFIVTVSFDRLYAIKAPFSARSQTYCSRHNLFVIPFILFLTGASCFHMNFKLLDDHGTTNGTAVMEKTKQSVLQFMTILMFVFHIVIPMILLITFHSFLLYYLRNRLKHFFPTRTRSARNSTRSDDVPAPLLTNVTDRSEVVRHSSSNSGVWTRHVSKAERHVTYTVVAIVTCYILSHIPSACLYVYLNLFQNALYTTRWMYTGVQFTTTVVTCSKVANFILFCMSSKHFRKETKKKLCFLFCKNKEGMNTKDSANQPRTRFRSLPLNLIGDSTHYSS
uniref:G_PROTEIN_RECEP_F1_2 domain-containing protein n=1 Tax=Caenorhabditis tropicalis TaxID=1561998 RepID=A0A1I7TJ83_9PELO